MEIKRRKSRKIWVGNVAIGGTSPISIQSMTTTDTRDTKATVAQIKRLERAGCQIIRVAVLDEAAAQAISYIKQRINIPLVADIHFNYKLALMSIKHGADKIRLNPGNIQGKSHVEEVVKAAKSNRVPIRIGLNSGSVKRTARGDLVDDMVCAGLRFARIFKKLKFNDFIFSFKTHDVQNTIAAYKRIAALTDAPLHLGVTAAGPSLEGIVKSSIGIGALLIQGLGDTVRVSLTDAPEKEIEVAKKILAAVGMSNCGIEIISCPMCGRCKIDLIKIVKQAEAAFKPLQQYCTKQRLRIAIMGCVVNGPGEARDCDIGIAWGGTSGILFRKGKKIKLIKKSELIKTLVAEVRNEVV